MTTQTAMDFRIENRSADELKAFHRDLLFPRMVEEKMLKLLRQGKISKWFSGIGQEAISVGCTKALQENEYIFTMHRNLGVFTTRKLPLSRLIAQWQGKSTGYTQGRDRSFHFGSKEDYIVGMISHLGPQLSLANGAALAHTLQKQNRVALAFTGEGGTSEGEFHEALNVAAVWNLPVIFIIENNGYGLSTPTNEQYVCEHLVDRAKGYGMKGLRIDGNNVLEVYDTVRQEAESMRENPRPVLIECDTFRMRGHEEASGTKYVPQELFDYWEQRDPVVKFERLLLDEGILSADEVLSIRKDIKADIEVSVKKGFAEPDPIPDADKELQEVYAPFTPQPRPAGTATKEMRLVDAISDGLREAMREHDELVLMGQDVGEYGGVFKITDGFIEEFGAERVRNTPLCESAIVGAALGLSLEGQKAMVEMQFADFVTVGFNQIVNNLAKLHYRWSEAADVVIRMPTGGTVGAGPFHSQSNEAWFAHTPGLKVVYPSSPADAKGLLLQSFEDPNPVLFFEHKGLYRAVSEEVPEGYYNIPFGKARRIREGSRAVIITYGMGVKWAREWAEKEQADVEIIDLRTLVPLDWDTIAESVKKCHRAMVLHEDTLTGGFGGELAARISEHLFEHLDAPVMRCASMDTPVPFAAGLEAQFMASGRLQDRMQDLLNY